MHFQRPTSASCPSWLSQAASTGLLLALILAVSIPAAWAEVSRSQQLKAETFDKMSRGIKAVRDGDPKTAIQLLEEVALVAMNSFRAHYYLGLAYKADRQYLKAIKPLIFALDLDPTHMQAHVDLGDCYLKRGDIGEALAEYHRSLEIQQGFAPAWDGLGRAAEASGDDDKAVERFKKAIDLNPGFPGAALNLGDLYLRAGRLREAVDLFLQAISVRPNFAAAYNRLGVAYSRQRLGNEAIAALRKAADLERGNPWHPFTIGEIEMDLGYLGRALSSFDASIRIDENYLEAYVAKAELLRKLGRFQEAEFLLEAAADRPSEDTQLLRDIRKLREEFRVQRLTIDDIEARAEAGMATVDEIRSLAGLRAETGNYTGAAKALQLARLQPAPPEGEDPVPPEDPLTPADRFRLGYYQLHAEQFVEAVETFTALRGEQPDSLAILLNLGLSLEGQGNNRAAAQAYEDALSRRPGDPVFLTALGNMMVIEGRFMEALNSYQRALAYPEGFDGRARVETILQALKAMPAAGGAGGSSGARGAD